LTNALNAISAQLLALFLLQLIFFLDQNMRVHRLGVSENQASHHQIDL
jgi:hypothetical protein